MSRQLVAAATDRSTLSPATISPTSIATLSAIPRAGYRPSMPHLRHVALQCARPRSNQPLAGSNLETGCPIMPDAPPQHRAPPARLAAGLGDHTGEVSRGH